MTFSALWPALLSLVGNYEYQPEPQGPGIVSVIIGIGFWLVLTGLWIWMMADAFVREEYIWAVLILIFPPLTPILYAFLVFIPAWRSGHGGGFSPTSGFELPGQAKRRRTEELKAEILRLDRPHHYLELGDIYFQEGRLALARENYEAAYERDDEDIDIQAHLGQCRLRQGEVEQALPLLESVIKADPKHDYGHTAMALAEAHTELGNLDAAERGWQQVLANNSYARARVQYARLLAKRGKTDQAREQLEEVVNGEALLSPFQRRREMKWLKEARTELKALK